MRFAYRNANAIEPPVTLLCHSMGGVLSHYYLTKCAQAGVDSGVARRRPWAHRITAARSSTSRAGDLLAVRTYEDRGHDEQHDCRLNTQRTSHWHCFQQTKQILPASPIHRRVYL